MASSEQREQEKRAAAERGVSYVESGMTIGLGSGSTSAYAVASLGERVRGGLTVRAVPTSSGTRELALREGITLIDLTQAGELDLTIDGADEIDPALQLTKGGGGALLREKVVASASRRLIIIADSSKQVPVLGAFPLPVAVAPFALPVVARRLREMHAEPKLRLAGDQPFVTDDGGYILDCHFGRITDPVSLARELEGLPGIFEHGLFIDMASVVVIATGETLTELRR